MRLLYPARLFLLDTRDTRTYTNTHLGAGRPHGGVRAYGCGTHILFFARRGRARGKGGAWAWQGEAASRDGTTVSTRSMSVQPRPKNPRAHAPDGWALPPLALLPSVSRVSLAASLRLPPWTSTPGVKAGLRCHVPAAPLAAAAARAPLEPLSPSRHAGREK